MRIKVEIFAIIITALLVGSGVFWYQKSLTDTYRVVKAGQVLYEFKYPSSLKIQNRDDNGFRVVDTLEAALQTADLVGKDIKEYEAKRTESMKEELNPILSDFGAAGKEVGGRPSGYKAEQIGKNTIYYLQEDNLNTGVKTATIFGKDYVLIITYEKAIENSILPIFESLTLN